MPPASSDISEGTASAKSESPSESSEGIPALQYLQRKQYQKVQDFLKNVCV